MRVFWRKGYDATSLHDLLAAMGLSKSSFYQAFTSKHELFQQSLKLYRDRLNRDLRTGADKAESGRTFIESSLRGVAEETIGPDARIGCLLMNTASEFAQSDPVIARLVSEGVEGSTAVFEAAVRRAQQSGEVPRSKDPRVAGVYLVSIMAGMKNLVKAGADAATIKLVADTALTALD